MSYFEKYIKYKTKYIKLQNMFGGTRTVTEARFISILHKPENLQLF